MELRKSKYAIGIDLGTTNTCAAVWKDGKVQVIPNKFGNYLTPSWISYTDVEVIVGQKAKDDAHKNFKGTLFGIKRIIGRKYDDPIVQEAIKNWKFTVRDQNSIPAIQVIYKKRPKLILPEEASALILKEIKEVAEEYLGEKGITDAVITVPAYFNDHQRQATKDAAKIAGLNVIRLINEPTAAAVAYVFDKADKLKRNILVYDLGGGTFDVSIIKVEDCCVQVLATNGDTNLGGENFDQRLIDHFIQLLKDKYDVDIADASKLGMLARLRRQVQKAKHELSLTSTTTVEIDYIDGKVDMKEELKRTLVDSLNSDLFEKTIEIVKQCVGEAKLSKEDIDDIVLVGGSTRLTAIQRLLREYFGKKLCKGINQDQAVAHGAAILAANHNKSLPESLIILDVISMSLGLHTADQKMDVIIKRNTQVPTQAKRTYTIAGTGARTMRIKILMGDNEKAVDNLSLGYFDLLDLPTNPRVDVTFKLDVNGILTVDATEASAGIQKAIDVLLEKGRLTDKEIAKLQKDFDALSEENKRYHQVRDIRNKFESYLLKLKDDVNKKKYEISEQEQNSLLKIAMEGELFLKSLNSYDLKHLSNEYANVNRQCTAILKTSTDKTSGNRKK